MKESISNNDDNLNEPVAKERKGLKNERPLVKEAIHRGLGSALIFLILGGIINHYQGDLSIPWLLLQSLFFGPAMGLLYYVTVRSARNNAKMIFDEVSNPSSLD